jgi:hypothetical protein
MRDNLLPAQASAGQRSAEALTADIRDVV